MAKTTPSMAKNKMSRCLREIFDPPPSKKEKDKLWEYFESCCAYCGEKVERSSRQGHLDHLIPVSEGGSNNIYNYALSCKTCNGDEKREEDWESFLSKKVKNTDTRERRRAKIEGWLSLNLSKSKSSVYQQEINEIIEKALQNFDEFVRQSRELKKIRTKHSEP